LKHFQNRKTLYHGYEGSPVPLMENEKNFQHKTIAMTCHWVGKNSLFFVLHSHNCKYIYNDITFGVVSNEMPHTMHLSTSQKIIQFYLSFSNIDILCTCTATGKYDGSPVGPGFYSNETLCKMVSMVCAHDGQDLIPNSLRGKLFLESPTQMDTQSIFAIQITDKVDYAYS